MADAPRPSGFAGLLKAWFAEYGRDLPWRNNPDPYKVWVSEIILQQTRVAQGMPYYLNFVAQFPTLADLAAAPLDSVMKAWQGLGYYTRARNLHRAAQIVVQEHGGELPRAYAELLKLPGLGPYAAAAVASFAFREAVPAIDGNVYRVLARVYGIFEHSGTATGRKLFWNLAEDVMDRAEPHIFNQAIIDFGALQCTPGMPDCPPCPFSGQCYAEANGLQSALPAKARALKLRRRYLHFLMLKWDGSTFIELRQGKDIWHSLYQFPLIETQEPANFAQLEELDHFRELVGQEYELEHTSEPERQLLSHQELIVTFYIIRLRSLPYSLLQGYRMVRQDSLGAYQVPRILDSYLAAEEAATYFYDDAPEGDGLAGKA